MKKALALALALLMLLGSVSALAVGEPGTVPERPLNGKTLKILLPYYATDPNLEPPAAMVEKVTGYKANYFLLPSDAADEKLNLEIASGAEYDLIRMSPNQFQSIAPKGALTDLTDYVRNSPAIMSLFTEAELSSATVDGKIYGIPQFDAHYVANGLVINKEMWAAAGFEYKEGDSRQLTLTQFEDMLRALKKTNPDVIPFTWYGSRPEPLMSAFGLVRHDWQPDLDGTIVPRFGHSNMKAYIAEMHKLYEEGLIDAEWPVNKSDTVTQKWTSGKAATMSIGWFSTTAAEASLKDATGNTAEYLVSLSDDNGFSRTAANGGIVAFMVVPKSSKQVEAVVDFLNIRAEPDVFEATFLGVENVQWEFRDTDGDGVQEYWPLLPPDYEPGFSAWFNGHYFNTISDPEAFTTLWLCRCRKGPVQYTAYTKISEVPKDQWVDSPLAYAPPLAAIAKYQQALNAIEDAFIIECIAGTRSVDEYEQVYQEWLDEGGQEMIDAVNAYVATMVK